MNTGKIIEQMANLDTIKIYAANGIAFLSTFTTLDYVLKTALILASIAYTVVKTVVLIKGSFKKDDKDNKDV